MRIVRAHDKVAVAGIALIGVFSVLGLILVGSRGVSGQLNNPAGDPTGAMVLESPECLEASSLAPDADAGDVIALGLMALEQAKELEEDALLRQVDVNLESGRYYFAFTNNSLTREIHIDVREARSREEFNVRDSSEGPLLIGGTPGFSIEALKIGLERGRAAMEQEYPGISLTSMTLFLDGCELAWHIFGEIGGAGFVAARIGNSTGSIEILQQGPIQQPRSSN